MRVIIERDIFASAISAIVNSTERRDTIPILGNVILRPNGSKMEMAGTDLDMQFETAIPAEITRDAAPGAITVKASIVSGIVGQLPKGAQVSLEWEDDKSGVTLKSGRSRYKLLTLPASDFPQLRGPQEPTVFTLPGKTIAAQLGAVRFAISKEVTRPYLCGAMTQIGDNAHEAFGGGQARQLEFVSTNGHQLARAAIEVPAGAAEMPKIIIPGRAVSEIIRLGTRHPDLDMTLAVAYNTLSASVADQVFTTKLIDGTFPDYVYVVPRDNERHVIVDVNEFTAALQRLHQLGKDYRTRAEISAGAIKLSLINANTGEAEEDVQGDYEGPDLTVGVNASEILEIVGQIDSDTCRIELGGPGNPIVMRAMPGGKPDYGCIYLCTVVRA